MYLFLRGCCSAGLFDSYSASSVINGLLFGLSKDDSFALGSLAPVKRSVFYGTCSASVLSLSQRDDVPVIKLSCSPLDILLVEF